MSIFGNPLSRTTSRWFTVLLALLAFGIAIASALFLIDAAREAPLMQPAEPAAADTVVVE